MSTRIREQIKKLADHIDENYEDKESIDESIESIDGEVSDDVSDESETTLENMLHPKKPYPKKHAHLSSTPSEHAHAVALSVRTRLHPLPSRMHITARQLVVHIPLASDACALMGEI